MSFLEETRTAYNQIGVDAGGRMRTSTLTTLSDLKTLGADRPLLIETAGTGTNTFAVNQNTMSVTAGQFVIRQGKRFSHYFSGKSQMIEMTSRNFNPEANVVKRMGYFSSNAVTPFDTSKDGVWLESDGTTIRLVTSRLGTDTFNVPITSWDGYAQLAEYQTVANWNRFTVLILEFLWLGGAVLRLWIKNSNGFTLCHTLNYAGSATADSVFIASPNQPIRYEIRSTTGTGTFTDVCSQVSTEGTVNQSGMSRSVNSGTTSITTSTIGTTYPLLAIRKQIAYRDIATEIVNSQIFVSSNTDTMLWSLQINPVFSAPLTYTAVANSAVEFGRGNGTITITAPGTVLSSGIITTNSVVDSNILNDNFLSYLGGSLTDVQDIICLCGTPITSGITSYSQVGYKEY
jgi:hypothetical protein